MLLINLEELLETLLSGEVDKGVYESVQEVKQELGIIRIALKWKVISLNENVDLW